MMFLVSCLLDMASTAMTLLKRIFFCHAVKSEHKVSVRQMKEGVTLNQTFNELWIVVFLVVSFPYH